MYYRKEDQLKSNSILCKSQFLGILQKLTVSIWLKKEKLTKKEYGLFALRFIYFVCVRVCAHTPTLVYAHHVHAEVCRGQHREEGGHQILWNISYRWLSAACVC